MKKTALLLSIVIIGGLFATPYFVGNQVEQIFAREIAQLQDANPDIQQVTHSYHKGLFKSQSHLELLIGTRQATTETITVIIESDISHGPLLLTDEGLKIGLFASHGHLNLQDLPEEIENFLQSTLGDNILTTEALVDFNQQLHMTADLQAFSYNTNEHNLEAEGAQLQVTGNLATNNFTGTIEIHPIQVAEGESRLDVSAAKGDFTLNAANPPLVTGNLSLLFDKILITDPKIIIVFENIGISTSQQLQEGKLNISETISIDSIVSPIALTGLSYQMDLQNLDPSAVTMWSQMVRTINQSIKEETDEIYQRQLRELASAIFQPGLELKQVLKLKASGGELLIDFDLRYTGFPANIHPMDVQNPVQFMDALDSDILLIADEQALMTSNAALIAQLYLEQGLLVREGNDVVLRAELRDGEFMINGKPFPLREILQHQQNQQQTSNRPSQPTPLMQQGTYPIAP